MKQVLLITVMLLGISAKAKAQRNNGIEIKNVQTERNNLQSENHQFEIVANEDLDVNLKFNLKTEDNVKIIVKDKLNNIILTDQFQKEGENRLKFTMEENDIYIVELIGEKQSNLIVCSPKINH